MSERSLSVLTPEMVRLDVEIAEPGARLGAFLIDVVIVTLTGTILTLIASWFFHAFGIGDAAFAAFAMLLWFVLRNFYFIGFELGWRGRTPGKKVSSLRVIAADGGALTADQIYARNLTREIELFLPLIALAAPHLLLPEAPVWVWIATGCWALFLGLLPVVGRHSARLGDLVAGTAVIQDPKDSLRHDVSAEHTGAGQTKEESYSFTDQQLDLYGAHELQVLEDVLRRHGEKPKPELLVLITEKIVRKIGWHQHSRDVDTERFLRAFYAAQRGRLEHHLVLGQRREHKVN